MIYVVLAFRLALAAILLVAGFSKLADLPGTRKSIVDFGIPQEWSASIGILLPVVEIAIAALLVPLATAGVGGYAAMLLLLTFVVGVITALARGQAPQCHCFGQLHSRPIGWMTLAQSLGLAFACGLMLWFDESHTLVSAFLWFPHRLGPIGLVLSLIAISTAVGTAWGLLHLLQQNGRLFLRMDELERRLSKVDGVESAGHTAGLPIGSPAPPFTLASLAGERVSLEGLLANKRPVLAVFSDPSCAPCAAILPDLGRWQNDYETQFSLIVVSAGSEAENTDKFAEAKLQHVLIQKRREIADAYKVVGTPSAVFVDVDGKIASPVVAGTQAIRGLVAYRVTTVPAVRSGGVDINDLRSLTKPRSVVGLEIGSSAPDILLPDLQGNIKSLKSHGLRPQTVLIFWDPSCGYCARMLPDLQSAESKILSGGVLDLVLISAGDEAANREIAIKSGIVLDSARATFRAFGVTGTPSAVLVDNDWKVASRVAVGSAAIFSLIDKNFTIMSESHALS